MDNPLKTWVPSLIFIELTKSCEYTCRHCRASAQTEPLPDELDLHQVMKELDSISELGSEKPLVIFTGGNPLRRAGETAGRGADRGGGRYAGQQSLPRPDGARAGDCGGASGRAGRGVRRRAVRGAA